jgi:hypothetical protein
MTSVFLSCARDDDEPFVRRLHADLTARGFDAWFDRVSMPARQLWFTEEIKSAMAARDRLLLVVGPEAAVRRYVLKEWGEALLMDWCVNAIVRLDEQRADGMRVDGYTLVPEPNATVALPRTARPPPESARRAPRRSPRPCRRHRCRRAPGRAGDGRHRQERSHERAGARPAGARRAFPDGVFWIPVGEQPTSSSCGAKW